MKKNVVFQAIFVLLYDTKLLNTFMVEFNLIIIELIF